MKKCTWRGEKESLVGHLVHKGKKDLSFDLLRANGEEVTVEPRKGITIISTFPALNTEICDVQSSWFANLAANNEEVNFVSISTDKPDVIDNWCNARKFSNLYAYSDFENNFGNKTHTLLKKRGQLARGFMVFKDNELVEVSYNREVQSKPNYEVVEKYL